MVAVVAAVTAVLGSAAVAWLVVGDGAEEPEPLPVADARVHVNLFSGRSNPVIRISPERAAAVWDGLEGLEETTEVFEWYEGLGFRGFIVTAEDAERGKVAVEVRPGNVLVTRVTGGGAHDTHLVDPDDSMMLRVADLIEDDIEEPGVREVLEPWFG
ncbi:MAG: hypothetical protein JJU45_06940 [Acidimicrobiia bacterium]|nr:hypothetical protein [Acidimicrobiia bacterium]